MPRKTPTEGRKIEQEKEEVSKTRKALDFDVEPTQPLDKKKKQIIKVAGSVRRTRGAAESYAHTTKVLKMFSSMVQRTYGDDGPAFPYLMDDGVYGMPGKAYVSKKDCETLLEMGWAENSHIETYSA